MDRECMMKIFTVCAIMASAFLLFLSPGRVPAAEKLRFGTAVKVAPTYYLPMYAADEKGFWKKNGLDVEWVPFEGMTPMFQAIAGGHLSTGFTGLTGIILGASQGLPIMLVSDMYSPDDFLIWVRTDSRIQRPRDLKGAKVGVSRTGGTEDWYARAIAKALGIERELKVVGTGGIPQALAALKAGVVDAVNLPLNVMINLKVAGEVREVASNMDYLPKEWVGFGVLATVDMVNNKPDIVRRIVRAVVEAVTSVRDDSGWSMEKMKSVSRFSDSAARLLHEDLRLRFTKDGKFTRAAVKNVRDFFIQYGDIPKEKVPPVEELYAEGLTP